MYVPHLTNQLEFSEDDEMRSKLLFTLSALVRSNKENIKAFGGKGFVLLSQLYSNGKSELLKRILDMIGDFLNGDMVEGGIGYRLPSEFKSQVCQGLDIQKIEKVSKKKYGSEIENYAIKLSEIKIVLKCGISERDEL